MLRGEGSIFFARSKYTFAQINFRLTIMRDIGCNIKNERTSAWQYTQKSIDFISRCLVKKNSL